MDEGEVRAFIAFLESFSPDEISFDDRWALYQLWLDLQGLLEGEG